MKLIYITNIPAPYRNKRFNLMQEIFPKYGIDFEVAYMAKTEPNRNWKIHPSDFKYSYHIFKGIHPKVGNMFAHFNLGFLLNLLKKQYNIAIVGGMGCPSHWLSPFFLSKSTFKVLSVESNLDSTIHKKGLGFKLKKLLTSKYNAYQITGYRAKKYLEFINPAVTQKPFITLPNIIDETVFIGKIDILRKDRENIRKSLGVLPTEQMWICPARLEKVKGLHIFLPSLQHIKNIKLFIAGTGSLKEELDNLIKQLQLPVTLVGFKTEDELLNFYAAADLFVLPSLSDPSPLSPIEAIAAKLPILVSNRIGNYEDVLVENENGWGFDLYDSTTIQSKLNKIAKLSPSALNEIGDKSRARYLEVFDTEKCIKSYAQQLKVAYQDFVLK